jgi:hypothetical protein
MSRKNQLTVHLDEVHLKLLDGLQPFFGNSRPEVVRNIVILWLKAEYGLKGLQEKGAVQ